MAEHRYEIEIKSLLGSAERAEALVKKMQALDPAVQVTAASNQLNHYFVGGDGDKIFANISPYIEAEKIEAFKKVLFEGKNISVRTRQANDTVFFVVKASIDDTTSSNGTARIEFEKEMPLSLEALDQLLLDAGCTYQAKWSRDRKEYQYQDIVVCIDRNAGYGYLAELEKIVHNDEEAETVKGDLRGIMQALEIEELSQERLERMFAFYNEHWPEYYGTDKIFNIE
jgi:predicted adenylyl cyclase CyaB